VTQTSKKDHYTDRYVTLSARRDQRNKIPAFLDCVNKMQFASKILDI